jgi:hypothetical protein
VKSEINETNLASAIIAWPVIKVWSNPLQFTVFAGADSRTFDVAQRARRRVSCNKIERMCFGQHTLVVMLFGE